MLGSEQKKTARLWRMTFYDVWSPRISYMISGNIKANAMIEYIKKENATFGRILQSDHILYMYMYGLETKNS